MWDYRLLVDGRNQFVGEDAYMEQRGILGKGNICGRFTDRRLGSRCDVYPSAWTNDGKTEKIARTSTLACGNGMFCCVSLAVGLIVLTS